MPTVFRLSQSFRQIFGMLLCTGLLALTARVEAGQKSLSRELRERGTTEGLALVRTGPSNYWDVVPFGERRQEIRNPRGFSGAWFSPDGNIVAWKISALSQESFKECPDPIIVSALDGTQIWQVPGNVINTAALGVSGDGKQVAFDATSKPPGTGFLNTSENRARWVTGLQLADYESKTVSLILPIGIDNRRSSVGSISWSPDGNAFAYDFQNQVYVYDLSARSSRELVSGSNPTWSPDGKWVAYRSLDGEGYVIDPKTGQSRQLIPRRKILWGIHWSPDSTCVAFGESIGVLNNLLHLRNPILGPSGQMVVYRIRDGASFPVYWFGFKGGSDRGFKWIRNYRTFLKNASVPPVIRPCDRP